MNNISRPVLISLTFIEVEVTESFPVMIEEDEIIDRGLMTGIEEDFLLLDSNPKDIILQEVLITGKTNTLTEVTAKSLEFKAHPYPLLEDQQLHLGH